MYIGFYFTKHSNTVIFLLDIGIVWSDVGTYVVAMISMDKILCC